METTYTYKKQGNGKDSWTCEIKEGETLIDRYMVYEDPSAEKKVDLSNIDIDSLTDEQILKLKARFSQL